MADKEKKTNKKSPKANKAVAASKSAGKFLHEVYLELKKVTWPTKKELSVNVTTVLVVMLIATIIIGAIDYGTGTLYQKLLTLVST